MRLWFNSLLRLAAGAYFVVSSMYCLLAFLPYTYYAFIKAPPYAWMPRLAHHQAALYWAAIAAALIADERLPGRWKSRSTWIGGGLLAAAGVYLAVRPFLPGLESNRAAYGWSLISLVPLAGVTLWQLLSKEEEPSQEDGSAGAPFSFSAGFLSALVVSLIYTVGARIRVYSSSHTLGFHWQEAEIILWSLVSHAALAVVILSAVNLIFLAVAKSSQAKIVRRGLIGILAAGVLSVVLARFLGGAMSFDGWAAYVYAGTLGITLTLWAFWMVRPFLARVNTASTVPAGQTLSSGQRFGIWVVMGTVTLLALSSRWLIVGEDWNGFVEGTGALLFWMVMSLCVYRLRPVRAKYSAVVVVGILLVSIFVYKALQATEIFWGKPLGSTDDEISITLEKYGADDASFLLAHHMLGNGRGQPCGDLCRITREYTNIRDAHTQTEVRLVDNLSPGSSAASSLSDGARPNIFVFVIDAMRPDYLGAYNPRVDYTPNLDAFARDSVVLHHAYTQYAGTSLSEPALWAGAMMLHAHYLEPFSRVNSLEKLLHADDYQMVVSADEILKEILPPSNRLTQLDLDKQMWNQLEIGSTLKQMEAVLDARSASHDSVSQEPIFFYDQPKNVHQFARNDIPTPTQQHWQGPAGMNGRITCEVHWVDARLGEFFSDLKRRGMYDNSIIIVTSDHGDATGEFGRSSHSTSIWPEIMRVPLIIHLPAKMREQLVYDDTRLSTLTDITPTLYYLLGHRPVRQNPMYGRPLFAETQQELDSYKPHDLLLASDVRAVYGILTADGRYFYTTYDSPAQSYLFDLATDSNAEHNMLTPQVKQRYDEEIIEHLQMIGDFYGYKPGVGSLVASAGR
jgi:hypothetical protein